MKTGRTILIAGSLFVASLAGAHAEMSPALQKKAIAACDAKIRSEFVAPNAAEVIAGTVKIAPYTTPGVYYRRACYQTRSRIGGFATLASWCHFSEDGTVIGAGSGEDTSGVLCEAKF